MKKIKNKWNKYPEVFKKPIERSIELLLITLSVFFIYKIILHNYFSYSEIYQEVLMENNISMYIIIYYSIMLPDFVLATDTLNQALIFFGFSFLVLEILKKKKFIKLNIDVEKIEIFLIRIYSFILITMITINFITIMITKKNLSLNQIEKVFEIENFNIIFEIISFKLEFFLFILIILLFLKYKQIISNVILKLGLLIFILNIILFSFYEASQKIKSPILEDHPIVNNFVLKIKEDIEEDNEVSKIIKTDRKRKKELLNNTIYKSPVNNLLKQELNIDHIFILVLESIGQKVLEKNSIYISKLKENSIIFDNNFANASYTSSSLISLLNAEPIKIIAKDLKKTYPGGKSTNGTLDGFKKKGFKTTFSTTSNLAMEGVFFRMNYIESKFDNIDYLKSIENYNKKSKKELESLYKLVEDIDKEKKTMNVHLTYMTHYPYYDYHSEKPADGTLESYKRSMKSQDKIIKKFIDRLKDKKIYKKSMIVIIGDHGQAFGEHRTYTHGALFNEVLKVPAIIHSSQFERQYKIKELTDNSMVLPTIYSILNKKEANNSIFSKKLSKRIFSYQNNSISFIDRESKEKVIMNFVGPNKCVKYNLSLDKEEKNKKECTREDKYKILEIIK